MPSAALRTRPRPRAAGVVVMLALHAGLLIGIWSRWPARRAPHVQEQAPLIVRLLGLRPAAPAVPTLPRQQPAPVPVRAVAPGAAAPQAITLPSAPEGRSAIAQPGPVSTLLPPLAAASAPASAPLDLKLRGGPGAGWRTPAQAALDDPRANTPRATLEGRIAAVLGGSDEIVEEHLADGSVRFRRGQSCVIARPNRAQGIDPFNGSVSPKPRLIDSC